MKKLGLLGGMGPEATLRYYRDIEYGVMERLGADVLPRMAIESLSCFKMIPLGAARDYDGMTEYLMGAVRSLEAAGCDFAAMACCTGHMVFDRVAAEARVPMLSIVDACVDEARRLGHGRLLLLGTEGTMRDDYFKRPFREAGIDVVEPAEKDLLWVGETIEHELEHGLVTPQSRERFMEVVAGAASDGADGVILGCTELPMVFDGEAAPLPSLDATWIHIQRIVEEIVSE